MDTISLAEPQSALPLPPAPALATPALRRSADAVARGVCQALAAVERPYNGSDRRREPRLPYPYPIYLTPLSPAEQPLTDETVVVIGRHLSEHGLDFYHREALAYRRAIASLDAGRLGYIGLLLELTWCRFTRHGWYDNGGRFLAAVPSPLET